MRTLLHARSIHFACASVKALTPTLLLGMALLACSPREDRPSAAGDEATRIAALVPGKTDAATAESALGKPWNVALSALEKGSEQRSYANGVAVQYRDGKVVRVRRPAIGDEAHIQYWLHAYRSKSAQRLPVLSDDGGDPHAEKEEQLVAAEEGRTVVFESETGRVLHVYEYERLPSGGSP